MFLHLLQYSRHQKEVQLPDEASHLIRCPFAYCLAPFHIDAMFYPKRLDFLCEKPDNNVWKDKRANIQYLFHHSLEFVQMASSTIACDNCGTQNPASESFCITCGYALAKGAAMAPSVPTTLTGRLPIAILLKQRYRILRTVGQGGMGAVYQGEDTQLGNRLVAIKEMSQSNVYAQQAQDAIADFKREAHLLAGLQHPNLPSIHDYFEEAGRWYLVMSFIEGETLADYLEHAQDHKLSLEETLSIGQTLCQVLNYLHSHKPPIIFRDLKPSNIMRSSDGHLYLIDFGIARHFKPGQAKDTASYGSMGYAPPEQFGKAQTTERSDIYSLGATLYECLSGYDPSQSPFRLPPLQTLAPTLPERLVTLITQMLEMDDNKRPANVRIVEQGLRQVSNPALKQYAQPASAPIGSTPPRQHTPVPSTPKRAASPLPAQQPAISSSPTSSAPGQKKQIQQQLNRARASSVPTQARAKKATPFATNPKVTSFFWMIVGVLFLLNGVTGPFRFNLETAGGIFGEVTIAGFSGLLGLMIMLLARTKRSIFPITKARQVEYGLVLTIGSIAIVFGITVAIIGAITNTPTNSNDVGIYLGVFSIIMSLITLWVTHLRIKNTP